MAFDFGVQILYSISYIKLHRNINYLNGNTILDRQFLMLIKHLFLLNKANTEYAIIRVHFNFIGIRQPFVIVCECISLLQNHLSQNKSEHKSTSDHEFPELLEEHLTQHLLTNRSASQVYT